MFTPVLLSAFKSKHDADDALDQWLHLATMETEVSCDLCPACHVPTLNLGGTDFSEQHVDVDKETDCGADRTARRRQTQ
jgi:hypothetical protein